MIYFDLVSRNRSDYTNSAAVSQRNAQWDAADRCRVRIEVDLRVQVMPYSCNVSPNCGACAGMTNATERGLCYAAGCSCFGVVVLQEPVHGRQVYEKRRSATCALQVNAVVFRPRAISSQ